MHKLDVHHQPPIRFERQFSISDIAGIYQFPNDWLAEEAEHHFRAASGLGAPHWPVPEEAKNLKTAQELLEIMTGLNPSLANIPCDLSNLTMIGGILIGTASAMNTDDIDYYTHTRKSERDRASEYGHMRSVRNRTTLSHGKSPLSWHIAPKTAELIHCKLDEIHGAPGWNIHDPSQAHSQFSQMAPI